jgi:hypothetical protein
MTGLCTEFLMSADRVSGVYSLRFNPVAPAPTRTHRAAAAWSIFSGSMLPRRTLEKGACHDNPKA